jgi:hypothetical protein
MLTGRRANGASKIRSEPPLAAAAPEGGSILIVQNTLTVGKLVHVEVAAEFQLKEGHCHVNLGRPARLRRSSCRGSHAAFWVIVSWCRHRRRATVSRGSQELPADVDWDGSGHKWLCRKRFAD